MIEITDPLRQHDWNSEEYVEDWAQRQRRNETLRARQFALLASLAPFEGNDTLRFMDVGCGYGALSKFLLESFPRATAGNVKDSYKALKEHALYPRLGIMHSLGSFFGAT